MASKKISQLPVATTVTNASLLPVVTNGITEKVTISQLPTGVTTVNNLGGGTPLGTVVGAELQLKTIIPGTGLSFTTTSNTITINSNLNVTNVGPGISIINTFSNPNLALKSITGSNGINITNNTTSINIANSVDTTTDSIIGLIEIPSVKLYKLDPYINKAFTINKLYTISSSGTATVRLKIQNASNVDVTTTSSFSVGTSRSENIVTGLTTSIGQQLLLEVVSTNTCLDLSFTIDLTYV